jgi:Flp pilus assembly protein TadD
MMHDTKAHLDDTKRDGRVPRRLLRTGLSIALVVATLVFAQRSRADGESNETLFTDAVAALDRGAFDDAIDRFELLADRGFSHPDASYDRAIAYVRRADSRTARRCSSATATPTRAWRSIACIRRLCGAGHVRGLLR